LATVDVTIMGAGIFGLSIAWTCAARGARVRVIDPNGAGSGASGGLTGALAPHTPERWEPKKAFQLDSLLAAQGFWAGVDAASGVGSGYGRTGRLQPIADEKGLALARERIAQADEFWQGKAVWQVRPASDFAGWVPPSATGLVVHDTLGARMDPRRACASLVGGLQSAGVGVARDGVAQGAVIWATGYRGLLDMSAELGPEMGNGVKGQSVLLEHDAGQVPQVFSNGIHFIAHDNGTVAIGSTSERNFDDPVACDSQLDDLLVRARAVMPVLANAPVLARWAGVRPRAITRAPLLGRYPGRAGHFVANGGFKIGFGMAPGIAQVMADLVLEGVDNIPPDFNMDAALAVAKDKAR
jgi:glycine oxidase